MEKLISALREFNKERDWDQFHSAENLAKSISIEAGELLECFQWSNDFDVENLREELADVGSDNSINEIGCIHTVQGYDLNYLGVIIGEDLKYDNVHGEIVAHAENYYDSMGKAKIADDKEQLREYLLNIYMTLMTRGIRGTYVYVCDPALREYMSHFIQVVE